MGSGEVAEPNVSTCGVAVLPSPVTVGVTHSPPAKTTIYTPFAVMLVDCVPGELPEIVATVSG